MAGIDYHLHPDDDTTGFRNSLHAYIRQGGGSNGGPAAVETTALNGASQRRLMVVLVDEMNGGEGKM